MASARQIGATFFQINININPGLGDSSGPKTGGRPQADGDAMMISARRIEPNFSQISINQDPNFSVGPKVEGRPTVVFSASIVISTFNRTTYISELLESLVNQSHTAAQEIIIIEAGSDESYQEILNISEKIFAGITVLHRPNCTLGESRNIGVDYANNYWCFFSDDDDIWHPKKIYMVSKIFELYDVISHEYVSSVNPDQSAFLSQEIAGETISRSFIDIVRNLWGNRYGGGSSLSGRREFLSSIKFDVHMRSCEDIEWIIRATLSGARMGFINSPLVCYRKHQRRMTAAIGNNIKWEIDLIKKFSTMSFALLAGVTVKGARVLIRFILRR